MKKSRYRILSVLMAVIMVICAVPASVSAASTKALPSLSTSKYIKCYTLKSSGRIDAYTDSDLKTKKKNWYIDCSTDECWIVGVKDKAVKVSYPSQAKSGRSTAWFKRSDFTSTDISKKLSVMKTSKQITSYRRSDGKNEYGYAGKGDEIYKLQTSGKYTQIVYPLTGQNWKMGWVKTSELDKNTTDKKDSDKTNSSNDASYYKDNVGKVIANLGSYKTDLDGYTGIKGQCVWYVRNRGYEKLGKSGLTGIGGNAKTWYSTAKNKKLSVGSTPKANSIACWSGGSYGHVAYVEYYDSKNSIVYFTEANTSAKNGELQKMSLSKFKWKRPGSYQGCIYLK